MFNLIITIGENEENFNMKFQNRMSFILKWNNELFIDKMPYASMKPIWHINCIVEKWS